VENTQKGQESIIISNSLVGSGILGQYVEEHLLLIVRKSDIRGNHDLGSTSLGLGFSHEAVLCGTLLPGDGGLSQKDVFQKIQRKFSLDSGQLSSGG
jgi:hypothetical protein